MNQGDIPISGAITGSGTYTVEARFNGGAWTTIANNVPAGEFNATLTNQTMGTGTLEWRVVETGQTTTVNNVSIGDVYIVGGQSNAVGEPGTPYQSYSHATLKAHLFGNDYQWKELVDPTDSNTNQVDTVSSDSGSAGTVWPLLAQHILDNTGVPVAFVPCAKGATTISQWQPGANHQDRTTLYGSMVYRALQTGCKAVLWWQGESDGIAGTSQASYNAGLDTLANAIQSDLGVSIMPCLLQSCTGIADANEAPIRAAIIEAQGDNANVLTGPDFGDIVTDDAYHLKTAPKLQEAANRWWTALEAEFYS